jgi:SAM-dependent methyltransferase
VLYSMKLLRATLKDDDILSCWFDELYQPSREIISFYKSLVKPDLPVLELGCRSGRVSLAFAEEEIRIVGVDRSRRMIARAKARSKRLSAAFRVCDIRRYDFRAEFPGGFGLIIAPSSILNEITGPTERIQVYRCALKHLAPQGIFAFDVGLFGEGYLTDWGSRRVPYGCMIYEGRVEARNGKQIQGFACKNYVSNTAAEWTLILDQIDRNDIVRRSVATIHQTYFSAGEVSSELREAGFKDFTVYDSIDGRRLNPSNAEGRYKMIVLAVPSP